MSNPFLHAIAFRRMDGAPESGFDCGRAEQNAYFYQHAWADQSAGVSVTYLYYVKGLLAGYVTVCADWLPLAPRERHSSVRYQEAPAIKLAQLAVATPFQGMGLGKLIVGDVVGLAESMSTQLGCRFITVDAKADLVGWYEAQGFVRNKLRQERRVQDAIARRRDPASIPVSMRFDIRQR